jgi:hypothetical protein
MAADVEERMMEVEPSMGAVEGLVVMLGILGFGPITMPLMMIGGGLAVLFMA